MNLSATRWVAARLARAGLAAGVAVAVVACGQPAEAGEFYVDASASTSGSGTVDAPFRTIQAAIDTASAGDVIRVATGTYFETVVLAKALRLEGGYAKDYGARDPASYVTTIKSSGGNVLSVVQPGAATVDGFRITGGRRGVLLQGGSPTLSSCTVEDNHDPITPHPRGGGIYVFESVGTVRGCIVRNNTADRGAGIASDHAQSVFIIGSVITDNVATGDHGGGIYVGTQNAVVRGNIIANNSVGADTGFGWGGGLLFFNPGNTLHMSFNIVTGNHAPNLGSGVFIDEGAVAYLSSDLIVDNQCGDEGGAGLYVDGGAGRSKVFATNVTIAGHNCPSSNRGGEAIYVDKDSEVVANSSIFWGNGGDDFHEATGSSLTLAYCISQEQVNSGPGNVQDDPLFADAAGGDYHVRSKTGRYVTSTGAWVLDDVSSPAIDSGDPAIGCPTEPSPNGKRVNMGAFGNTPQASLSDDGETCGNVQPGGGGAPGWIDPNDGASGGTGGESGADAAGGNESDTGDVGSGNGDSGGCGSGCVGGGDSGSSDDGTAYGPSLGEPPAVSVADLDPARAGKNCGCAAVGTSRHGRVHLAFTVLVVMASIVRPRKRRRAACG